MTQAHLADAAGVSDDAISRAERGQAISLENAMAIAAFFNVAVAALAEEIEAAPVDAGNAGGAERDCGVLGQRPRGGNRCQTRRTE